MTQETKCRPRVSHAAASARNKITVRPARSPAPQRWAVAARACAVSVQEFEVEENIDFSVLTGRSSFCLQHPSGHPFVSFLFPFFPSPLSPSIPFLFIPVLILSHLYAPHQPDAVSRQFRFSVPELPPPGIGAKKKKKRPQAPSPGFTVPSVQSFLALVILPEAQVQFGSRLLDSWIVD
ncbi:uncharacterized protein APUU_31083A [Aspergillus puulaauensis]|uniref:Uncharacterized protein n=1 Tax=Aspergillus puulaauensis TaxID=1220207 RepID=A0A7R7XKP3_9EURO|nr:uncharacterized protein APUU_31083A [Aspergillus puulaauensis]BCS22858.1 hypothetical protein APUU_31083A [Aspergillus puulaauensis]